MEFVKFLKDNPGEHRDLVKQRAYKHGCEINYNFSPADGAPTMMQIRNKKEMIIFDYTSGQLLAYAPRTIVHRGEPIPDSATVLYPYRIGTQVILYHHDGEWKCCTPNAFNANSYTWIGDTYLQIMERLVLNRYPDLDTSLSYSLLVESPSLSLFAADEEQAVLIDVRRGPDSVFVEYDGPLAPLKDKPIEPRPANPEADLTGQIDRVLQRGTSTSALDSICWGYVSRTDSRIDVYPSDIATIVTAVSNNPTVKDRSVSVEYRRDYILLRCVMEYYDTALKVLLTIAPRHKPFVELAQKKIDRLIKRIAEMDITTLEEIVQSTEKTAEDRFVITFLREHQSDIILNPNRRDTLIKAISDFVRNPEPRNISSVLEVVKQKDSHRHAEDQSRPHD